MVAPMMIKAFHHEGTKSTKVSDNYLSELRVLRVFVVR